MIDERKAPPLIGTAWRGQYGGWPDLHAQVIRTDQEWKTAWAGLKDQAPSVVFDGKTVMAVVIHAGTKPTGGFRVEIEYTEKVGDRLTVAFRVHEPDGFVTQALANPYLIQLVPYTEGQVTFTDLATNRPIVVDKDA